MNKYKKAAKVRGAILVFLNEKGPQPMADIRFYLGRLGLDLSLPRVSQYLVRMEELGEVERRNGEAISPSTGKRCGAWVALVKRTVSATVMGRHVGANANCRKPREYPQLAEAIAEAKESKKRPKTGPNGGRVHYSGDIPAISKYPSGGQGALVRPAMGSGMYGGDW